MTGHREAAARAADAILDGRDPLPVLADVEPRLQDLALELARSCTALACWHAERIAALPAVEARRAALEELPAKLQPAVKRRLAALWKSREGRSTSSAAQPDRPSERPALRADRPS